MTIKPPQFPLAREGAGYAPVRRPGSIRRTTSIESLWAQGLGEPAEMVGRARDLFTPADGAAPVTLTADGFDILASHRREILAITTQSGHPRDQELVGVRAGSASREALHATMGDIEGAPLYQLIDDYAGASLVSEWILALWDPELTLRLRERQTSSADRRPMLNICTGFAEGSSALAAIEGSNIGPRDRTEVLPLENPADPDGWHEMLVTEGPSNRRARWIDVWREKDLIRADAGFQDSGNAPDGARVAIHEYRVQVALDAETMSVRTLDVLPLVLPFPECPGASLRASRMIGEPVGQFRRRVVEILPGTDGCTHLNDVLRALADVPYLAGQLPG